MLGSFTSDPCASQGPSLDLLRSYCIVAIGDSEADISRIPRFCSSLLFFQLSYLLSDHFSSFSALYYLPVFSSVPSGISRERSLIAHILLRRNNQRTAMGGRVKRSDGYNVDDFVRDNSEVEHQSSETEYVGSDSDGSVEGRDFVAT